MSPIEFIAAELGRDSIEASEKLDSLGMDSLEFLEFILVIENEYDVPGTKSVDCATVGDLVRLIESR